MIELLPECAQDRLRALRQRSDDLHAIIPEGETVREASMARIEADNALKRLVSHPQEFGHDLRPTTRASSPRNKHLDKMTADFTRLTELQAVRTAAWQPASQAKAAVEDMVAPWRPGNTTLEDGRGRAAEVEQGRDRPRRRRTAAPTWSRTAGRSASDRVRAVSVELRQAAHARTDRGTGAARCAIGVASC